MILLCIPWSMTLTTCSTVWNPELCLRSFLSFHRLYMHDWNTILSKIISMLCRLFMHKKCSVSNQSESVMFPMSRFTSISQTVNENGQAKNIWSLVSSLSPHRRQPCCIPQVLILSPVDNLFLTASHIINEKRYSLIKPNSFTPPKHCILLLSNLIPSSGSRETGLVIIFWMFPEHYIAVTGAMRDQRTLDTIIEGMKKRLMFPLMLQPACETASQTRALWATPRWHIPTSPVISIILPCFNQSSN